jgi:hypothetical protein
VAIVTGPKHGFELSPIGGGTSTRTERMAAIERDARRSRPWPSGRFCLAEWLRGDNEYVAVDRGQFPTLEEAMLHAGQVGEWRYRPRIGQSGPWYESSNGHWTIEAE